MERGPAAGTSPRARSGAERAAPPGRGFPGRAGPFQPGSERDVGVRETSGEPGGQEGGRGGGSARRGGRSRGAGRGTRDASGRPAAVPLVAAATRQAPRGCLSPRLAGPELHAAAVAPASEGRHVPARAG